MVVVTRTTFGENIRVEAGQGEQLERAPIDLLRGAHQVLATLIPDVDLAALPVIDPEDISAVAANVLTTSGHTGKVYELSGPESLSSEQQVNILAGVVRRPLKYVNVPDEAARDAMLGMCMPPRYVEAMVGLIRHCEAWDGLSRRET